MANLLKDHKFNEYCKLLKVTDQPPSDPDRRVIEKAFRRLALKTHPDKVSGIHDIISLVVFSPLQGGVCRRHSPGMQFGITEARLHAIETRLGTIRLDSTIPIL